jgi:hypothetical protein
MLSRTLPPLGLSTLIRRKPRRLTVHTGERACMGLDPHLRTEVLPSAPSTNASSIKGQRGGAKTRGLPIDEEKNDVSRYRIVGRHVARSFSDHAYNSSPRVRPRRSVFRIPEEV